MFELVHPIIVGERDFRLTLFHDTDSIKNKQNKVRTHLLDRISVTETKLLKPRVPSQCESQSVRSMGLRSDCT